MFRKVLFSHKIMYKILACVFTKHYLCTTILNIKYQTMKENIGKITITAALEPMQVGEEREFPAEDSMTVRSMASMLGFRWGRIFKTQTDRERRMLIVRRVE